MNRTVVAFIVAPLWVSFAAGLIAYISPYPGTTFQDIITGMCLGGLAAYLGEFALGLPAFLFLQSLGMTRLWIMALSGCIIGAVCGVVYTTGVMFYFSLGDIDALIGVLQKLFNGNGNLIQMSLGPSLLGAVGAATFWLVARPVNRQGAATSA
jgi:hypothetical protein